jgi:Holliday junction resolvase RusA-like endonuclease
MSIRFFVAGVPKSMSVGKTVRWKTGDGSRQGSFQKREHTEWATLVGAIGRQHAPARPLGGALIFVAKFYVPRPASLPKKSAHLAMPIKRPDLDNLFHKITDQWNGVLWTDDSVITDVVLLKRYPLDGRTGVEIIVAPVSNAHGQAEVEQLLLDRDLELVDVTARKGVSEQ